MQQKMQPKKPADDANRPWGAFTVDVEDYYQVSAFEGGIDRSQWSVMESRVVPSTQRLLALLRRHNVTATFFVLGWVAEHFPELVREIHNDGHEVGSHSYWHRLIYQQTPAEFREDLRRSRDVLEEIIGVPVTAYRAPSFSITESSSWAFEILVEEGFESDSSVFPIVHDRYGIPGANPRIHAVDTPAGELIEFPPSVMKLWMLNLPVGGGGYFRLYPSLLTRLGLSMASKGGTHPFTQCSTGCEGNSPKAIPSPPTRSPGCPGF